MEKIMKLHFKFTGVNLVWLAKRTNIERRLESKIRGLAVIRADRRKARKKQIYRLESQLKRSYTKL